METQTKKQFDAVQFMRDQRKLLGDKLSQMSKEEIVEYFRKKRVAQGVRPSAK